MATIKGTAGDDTLTGTSGNDAFNVVQGGEDHVSGLGGNDVFHFNASFDAGDQVDGGAGKDSVLLRGDYSAGVTLNATTLTDVEDITLGAGDDYNLTMNDGNVAAGQALFVNAAALTATDKLTFDGSAETNGTFTIEGGKGDDLITGGRGDDAFRLYQGGEDTAHGGAGSDTFFMGSVLDAGDTIDGGAGAADRNVVELNGDYSAGRVLGAATLSNIQEIEFHSGHSYNITAADGDFAAGPTIIINGTHLSSGRVLTFNAAAETDANFKFSGGAGNDVITGGQAGDVYDLSTGGHDTAHGGAGSDTFVMGSTFGSNDSIDGGGGNDGIQMDGMGTASSLTFKATTMVNVENLVLLGGHDYVLTTNDANVAAGASLNVNAIRLGASDTLTFNGAAETDGSFTISAGAGDATLTGGALADTFNITRGGIDTIHGGGGDDVVTAAGMLTAGDSIDGGAGNDTVKINGDYSAGLAFAGTTLTNVETLSLGAGHSYSLTTADGNVALGGTLMVDASALGASDKLTFNGSAETDGTLAIKGGAGDDTITLGAQFVANHDTVDGGGGNNTLALAGNPGGADLDGSAFQNIAAIKLAAGQTYEFAVSGDVTGGHGALTVDASALAASNSVTVDFSQATTNALSFTGGAGDDTVIFSSDNDNWSTVNGGSGNNTFEFNDSSAAIVDGASVTNFSTLSFADGHDYSGIDVTGDITGNNGTLTVDASAVGGGNTVDVDLSGVTSSGIAFTGGAGDDTVVFGANLANVASADGGAGDNVLALSGGGHDVTTTFSGANLANFSDLALDDGNNFDITVTGGFGGEAGLNIDASALSARYGATIDMSGLTNFSLDFTGGAGNDTVLAGADLANMTIDGGGGNDTLTASGNFSLNDTAIGNIEQVTYTNTGHADGLTITGDITSGGGTLSIDASGVSASAATNVIDLSAATTSLIDVTGGAGDDYVIFQTFNAAATFVGGDGYNEIAYQSPQSGMTFTSANYATVDEIDFNGTGDYTNISVVGDLTAGGDNAGDIDIYAGVLTGKIAVDLSAVTTSEIDFGGSTGDDTVTLSTANFNGSFLDGQSGNDTVIIAGDGTDFTSHTLTSANARNIANFVLTGDNNFNLTFGPGIPEAGKSVSVDASALTAGHSATVDYSHASTNTLSFTGGAGDDTVIFSGNNLAHAVGVSGGGGDNTFALAGNGQDVHTTFNGTTFAFFSTLAFEDGNNYDVTVASAFSTGAPAPLTIDASALSASYGATVDVSALSETVNFTGGAGDDTIVFGSDRDTWGTVDGGAGSNTFEFNDGSAAIVDGASVTNFSTLSFADGHDYSGIDVTGDITGGQGTLSVDASAVSSGHSVGVDLSGVTSSGIDFTGGAGDDTVVFGANLANVTSADGGAGTNMLALTGGGHDVTTTFGGANLANFSDLALDDGNNFDITVTGGFGGEAGLNIDASALSARYGATIDMSGLTNFSLDFTGGAGDDTVLAGADLGNMTIDGGTGTNVLKLDGDYSAGVTLSSITNIAEIDLAGGNAYNLTTTGVTVAAGVTLTVDASALGPNFGLTFNGSAETDGYFNIKGGAGDDSLTLQTRAVDNSTIDGGAGFNTVTLTGNLGGDESFNAASFTHIDSIDYAVGSFGGELSFTGDVTGDGSTLTVDETNADGFGGSGPDGDMLFTDISALTDTIDLTGAVVDDFVVVGSVNWTSLNGNGGNYNALIDTGTDPITFDAATITGFNTLVFAFDLNGNAVDFSGIGVVGDLTGNGGTLTIDAGFSSSISIDLSQATSDIAFDGSTGDDTITFGNNFSSGDMIQGNGGNDTLGLGRNTATLADTAVTGVGTVTLSGGSAFAVTGDISGNGLLTVDAGAVSDPLDNVNIDFSQATTATVDFTGGAGGDRVTFDASESNWGTVDGGTGINNFILNTGGAASIDGDSVTDFSAITLRDGGSYTLTLSGDIQGGGEALSVQASALSGGNSVSVDASASTDKISFIGGAGDDTFTGSNQGDMIGLGSGGIDTVRGGTGDDTITVSASSVGGDSIDGGAGVNTLNLSGSGEVDLNGAALTNIQTLNLSSNDVVIAGDIAGGQALTIDAANTHGLSLDLTQATTSSIAVTGGDGDDSIFFASQFAHLGTVDGGAGYDTIRSSGTLTLSDATISRVENVVYSDDDAGNAGLTITGDITTGGGALAIYAAGVGPSVYNAIDLAAATTATINVTGGAGNDLVTFSAGAHNWGTVDGGDGDNTFQLTGGSTGATIDGASVTHFSTLSFNDGYSYSGIILQNDITGSGGTLAIDASGLTGSNSVTIDASQATSAIDFAGGAGDDTVIFSQPSFFAEESYDGGAGYNTIAITPNDGSLGNFLYNLGDAYFTDLDEIDLQNGSNQGVQVTGDVSHTGTLKIDASALGAAYQATIDASAATSSIAFTGGAGDDTITASNSSHETDLDLSQGGEDTVHGGSASDFIYMGNALDTGDRIDGGGGFNYVYLEGDSYAGGLNLGAGELANVNYVQMFGNHTYVLTGDPAALNSSNFVTIDGGAMTGGSLQFDGSAVTDGTFSLYGGQGNDILLAGSGSDTLDLSVGGEDQLAGNGGNDIINAGGGLDAGDTVDGGAGTDTLNLNGDYSGGLVLGATTVTNVETFNFTAGHSYNITTNDATVASGLTLTVSASALGAGDSLTFNGAAETDGIFSITGGAGNDVITGGAQADSITIGTGGNDTVHGGDGNDQIFMMTQWTSADVLDGGAGNDFVGWGGKDYTGASALVLSATSLNSVEEIQCNNSHAYSLTMNDANVAAGATVLIDSTRSTKFTFNGSAETDGHFQIAGGAGADVLTAGQLSDTFIFYAVAGSTSTGYDTITNMNFSSDLLWLESGNGFTTDYKPTGVDAAITTGALSTATFNTNLAAAVNSSTLAAGHAVLFTANSGTLSGHTFLVVDHNGIAGYQASSDYVIDVTGDTGTLSTASFT